VEGIRYGMEYMGKRRRCIVERKGKGTNWLYGKEIEMGKYIYLDGILE
jgi:hypothetical protein